MKAYLVYSNMKESLLKGFHCSIVSEQNEICFEAIHPNLKYAYSDLVENNVRLKKNYPNILVERNPMSWNEFEIEILK